MGRGRRGDLVTILPMFQGGKFDRLNVRDFERLVAIPGVGLRLARGQTLAPAIGLVCRSSGGALVPMWVTCAPPVRTQMPAQMRTGLTRTHAEPHVDKSWLPALLL